MKLEVRVGKFVEEHRLFAPGDLIVVGVSGGPDSLCLLHILLRLGQGLRPTESLHVAHLDHGLRGPAASADAEFVADLAGRWGLPVTVETADVRSLARERRLSLEEAARQARYAFLASVASRQRAQAIAVGHNADDQAETVLMHFLRGSGVAGLRGMRPRVPFSELRIPSGELQPRAADRTFPLHNAQLVLVRPLLTSPRAEIESYCARHGLTPRLDASNLDTTFFRNRLRHEVLPLLEAVSPNLRQRLGRTAEVLAADYEALRDVLNSARALAILEETAEAITFDLAASRSLAMGLRRALMRDAVARLRADLRDISFLAVDAAVRLVSAGRVGARASLPGGLSLTLGYDTLRLASDSAPPDRPSFPYLPAGIRLPVLVPGVTALPGSSWSLQVKIAPPGRWSLETIEKNDDAWQAFIPWDSALPLSLRTRLPGDRIQPQGLHGASPKLSDFMIANKIPREWREGLPLLSADETILWVCGWRLAETAAVTADTRTVAILRFVEQTGAEP